MAHIKDEECGNGPFNVNTRGHALRRDGQFIYNDFTAERRNKKLCWSTNDATSGFVLILFHNPSTTSSAMMPSVFRLRWIHSVPHQHACPRGCLKDLVNARHSKCGAVLICPSTDLLCFSLA